MATQRELPADLASALYRFPAVRDRFLGLKPELQNVPSAKPVGRVVAQKTAPAAKVDKGSTVLLNVSKRPGPTTTTSPTTTTATTSTATTTAVPAAVPP